LSSNLTGVTRAKEDSWREHNKHSLKVRTVDVVLPHLATLRISIFAFRNRAESVPNSSTAPREVAKASSMIKCAALRQDL